MINYVLKFIKQVYNLIIILILKMRKYDSEDSQEEYLDNEN